MAKVHGQPWIYLQQQQQQQQGSLEAFEVCFPFASHEVFSGCTRFPSAAESDPSSSMPLAAAAAAYCDNKFYDLDYHDQYELQNLVKLKSSSQLPEPSAFHLGFPALQQQPTYTSRSTDFQLSSLLVHQQDQAFLQPPGDLSSGLSTIVHTNFHAGYQDPYLNAAAFSSFAASSQQQGHQPQQRKSSPSSSSSEIIDGPVLPSSSSSASSSKRRRLMPSEDAVPKEIQHAQQQQTWNYGTDQCVPVVVTTKKSTALNTNLRPRARQGSANDPQSIAARHRRERISDRLKILQELVPNSAKVDLVTMLEKAINYVKFLQLQVKVLTVDEYWPDQKKDKESMEA